MIKPCETNGSHKNTKAVEQVLDTINKNDSAADDLPINWNNKLEDVDNNHLNWTKPCSGGWATHTPHKIWQNPTVDREIQI